MAMVMVMVMVPIITIAHPSFHRPTLRGYFTATAWHPFDTPGIVERHSKSIQVQVQVWEEEICMSRHSHIHKQFPMQILPFPFRRNPVRSIVGPPTNPIKPSDSGPKHIPTSPFSCNQFHQLHSNLKAKLKVNHNNHKTTRRRVRLTVPCGWTALI